MADVRRIQAQAIGEARSAIGSLARQYGKGDQLLPRKGAGSCALTSINIGMPDPAFSGTPMGKLTPTKNAWPLQ